ncbi:MAG: hypothetical protein ACP5JJ_18470, partial [Anaerolineae bacterium]
MHFSLIPGDAISNHILEIDNLLQAWGLDASIYAGNIAPEVASRARAESEYLAHMYAPDNVLIYHYGLYSPGIRYFQASRGRKVLVYHNITPADYFRGWSRDEARLCDAGRRSLPGLADCDLALGDSEFNRQELIEAGFDETRTGVLPIFVKLDHFDTSPLSRELLNRLRRTDTANFLTVGRLVPS